MQYILHGHYRPRLPASAGVSGGVVTYAKPKAAAIDYRVNNSEFASGSLYDSSQGASSATLALHKKYPIVILGMSPSAATTGQAGYNHVAALVADDPTRLVGQYTIASQQFADLASSSAVYAQIYNALNAGGTDGKDYWARDRGTANNGTNGKMKSPVAINFSSWEVNLCSDRVANASGQRAAEIIADGYSNSSTGIYKDLQAAGLKLFFQDNVWGNPGSMSNTGWLSRRENGTDIAGTCGDYSMDNVNDPYNHGWTLRNTGVNPAYRQGQANFATRCKTNFGGGFGLMANADYDFINDATFGNCCLMNPEFKVSTVPVYRFAFLEGITSNFPTDAGVVTVYRSSFADAVNRIQSAEDNVTDGVINNGYVASILEGMPRTLQRARMCLGVSMVISNSWAAISDRGDGNDNMRPLWIDELDAPVGNAVDARQTVAASGFDGMYKREFDNALVIMNPTQNKGRWMGNGPVTTIARNGTTSVVTLKMPTANTPAGLLSGVRIRIQDCNNTSFNGVFTITNRVTNGANQDITWTQAGTNVTAFTPTSGFWGMQSSVNLTGQGWKRITGTDGGTPTTYDGTVGSNLNYQPSQNDGSVVTTLKLWPNDAVILIKA